MSELGSIMSGLAGERKTPKGEGKHYIPFSNEEWAKLAEGFGRTPEMLKPNDLKVLIMAMVAGKVKLVQVTDPKAA